MDFQSMKRRELQALCKMNNIPANLTNAAMADALSSLPSVEGLDQFLGQPGVEVEGSPERSVITSLSVPRTTTRRNVTREDAEGSKLTTRTRCGTRRRAVDGTDTKKTPATRTTRKRASKDASAQKQMQADFEADMEQSETSENKLFIGGELKEISEEVSIGSAVLEQQPSLESQNESQSEPLAAVSDENENKSNQEEGDTESVNQEDGTENFSGSRLVDFHCLSRRDLQGLCKKNKIAANTTNAMMADALEALEIVEGLEEYLQKRDTQAPGSPEMSEMTSSCARRTWTNRKLTKEPTSSKLIAKSCRVSRRRVIAEEIEQANSTDSESLAAPSTCHKVAVADTDLSNMQSAQKSEVQTYSRRESHRSTIKKREGKSGMKENITETVINVEKDLKSQLEEEAQPEKPEAQDCVSENSAGNGLTQVAPEVNESGESIDFPQNGTRLEYLSSKGKFGLINSESSETPRGFLNDEDSLLAEGSRIKGSEIPEQQADIDMVADTSIGDSVDSKKINEVELEITPPKVLVSTVSEGAQVAGVLSADSAEIDNETIDDDTSAEGSEDTKDFSEVERESDVDITPLEDVASTDSAKTEHEIVDDNSSVEGSEDTRDFSEVECGRDTEITPLDEVIFTAPAQSKLVEDYGSDSCSESSESNEVYSEAGSGSVSVVLCLSANLDDDRHKENQMSMETHAENNHESESESKLLKEVTTDFAAQSESKKLDSEPATQASPVPNSQREKIVTFSDPAPDSSLTEKLESSHVENKLSNTDSTFEADQDAHKGKETPLNNKSLRKLRRMLREKLQGVTVLEKKMEALALEENGNTLAEECESSEHEDIDVNAEALCPVSILVDNELFSESSVTGHINVDRYHEVAGEKLSFATPTKSSSTMKLKPVLSTPSKSATKTPKSVSRTTVSDINKENVEQSACKTEPGKINLAITGSGKILSAMSMGKLKKELKTLQQHSEKKRTALQARSENCCQLASP